MDTRTIESLESKQAELREAISRGADMRPGSLVERYRRCGKQGCHCAGEGERGHGPSWSLTREVAGKTVTKVIPPDAVDATQAQIAEHRRFRATVHELVETSERLCEARLMQDGAASDEAEKKGTSERPSRRKSSRRSTRS